MVENMSRLISPNIVQVKGLYITNPYTPEQNGVSERLNGTLVECAKSMIFHANMPINFWAEAVNTAVHLHNRSPTKSLNMKTPYEFGLVKSQMYQTLKYLDQFVTCIHLTICDKSLILDQESSVYWVSTSNIHHKLYDVESKKFVRSKDVVFYENKFRDFETVTKKLIIREDPPEEKLGTNHAQNHDVENQVH